MKDGDFGLGFNEAQYLEGCFFDFRLDGGVWAAATDEGPGWGSEMCPESEAEGPGTGVDPRF